MHFIRLSLHSALAAGLVIGIAALCGGLDPVSSQTPPNAKDDLSAAPAEPSAPVPSTPEPPAGNSQTETTTQPPPAPPTANAAVPVAIAPTPAAPQPAPASLAPPAKPKPPSAQELFGAVNEPANLAAKSIGFYAKGCLAGAKPLPINGPAWQAMRLSRNRNWGHPSLVKFIERFAEDVKTKDNWPGLLIGDMSMPRGGPMPFGHASHQVGLDVDIWYKPMPDHELSREERDAIPMESFLLDPGHVNPAMWTPDYEKLLRRAASYDEVARIFVNPAIKKWLCDNSKSDRTFLRKITPILGHDDHFHVRLACPANNPGCQNQAVRPTDEGCGKSLDHWIEVLSKPVPAPPPPKPGAPTLPVARARPPVPMAQLPPECQTVLKAAPITASQ